MRADTDSVTGNTSSKTAAEDENSVSSAPLMSLQQFLTGGPKLHDTHMSITFEN